MRSVLALAMLMIGCGRDARSVDDVRHTPRAERARFEAERRPDVILDALALRRGAKVADIGAGQGLYAVYLAEAVAPTGRVIATDIEKPVLDLLHARLESAGLDDVVEERIVAPDDPGLETGSYQLIVPDGAGDDWYVDPRSEAGTYDAILLAEVDQFLPDAAGWLGQARQALAPGGRIVITNRMRHRDRARDAARRAGLQLVQDLPLTAERFVLVLTH